MSEIIGSAYLSNSDEYPEFLQSVEQQFFMVMAENTPLFTTSATNLFNIFLEHLPENARQHYTCSACKKLRCL